MSDDGQNPSIASDAAGTPGAGPGASSSGVTLSDADAAVVDALLGSGNLTSPWAVASLPPGSAERAQKLVALLSLLDYDTVDQPPADLVARTVSRVASYEQRQTLSQQLEILREPRRTLGLNWGRALSAAALFVVGFSLLLPALNRTQADARRIACAANLGFAGQAFNTYAADNDGVLPRREVQPGAEWWHVGQPDAAGDGIVRSNSAHLYLLFSKNYAKANDLYCPENGNTKPEHLSKQAEDWENAEAVSFSYQNQYTPRAIRVDANPTLALLADKNPLFLIRVNRIVFDDRASAMAPSRSHGNRGQNILTADGASRWSVRPVIARAVSGFSDNVWLLPGVRNYTGTEVPTTEADRVDSFLVP